MVALKDLPEEERRATEPKECQTKYAGKYFIPFISEVKLLLQYSHSRGGGTDHCDRDIMV